MAKFYAVAKGKSGVPLILESWEACKAEVIGFKGAIYKSFGKREDAVDFIRLHGFEFEGSSSTNANISEGLSIYVDGSFMSHKNNFSYGIVVVDNGEVIHIDKGVGFDEEAISLRNVSGEVLGAMKAVDYAISKGYEAVSIFFDYQGIESWALGTWKRNNKITQGYHGFMQEKMKEIKISFKKVKGHSGDVFNDMADKLAKEALEALK